MKLINNGPQSYSLATPTGYIHLAPGVITEVEDSIAEKIIGKKSPWYDVQKSVNGQTSFSPAAEADVINVADQAETKRSGRPRKNQ